VTLAAIYWRQFAPSEMVDYTSHQASDEARHIAMAIAKDSRISNTYIGINEFKLKYWQIGNAAWPKHRLNDATWNPAAGCTGLTASCTNCYAMRMAARLDAMDAKYKGLTRRSGGPSVWTGKVRVDEKSLDTPKLWAKSRKSVRQFNV
jgi:hypothetical protein